MQYHHRNRLPPPPPPPFGRGGCPGYPRGHTQLYAPPPPLPSMPPAPQRKYEVLMEAGRLAAEYLVSQGVLPPAALQRGTGVWAVPPLPPPPPPPLAPPQQESSVFYGRRRYEDEFSNNPSARHRRANGTTSSTSSKDDYSSGSYNGRGKRKYGEYRRGYSGSGRDRENERGRTVSNSRRCEDDENEDGAPGFLRERRGSRWSDEVWSSVTEAAREETPLMAKAVRELGKEDTKSSTEDVQKNADAVPEVQDENEEGEVDDDSKVLNSESEVVEQATDVDTNAGIMELESNQLPDGKVPDEKAEDSDKISVDAAFEDTTLIIEVTNVGDNMCDVTPNLLACCDFARAPTRPRSVRAHRNAASVSRGTSVAATVDLVSSKQASQIVIDESAVQSSLSITKSGDGEDQIYQGNTKSGVPSDELMLLDENGMSVVTENIREEKGDEQLQLIKEYKEETSVSPFTTSHVDIAPQEDSLMQETDTSPVTTCHMDSLPQEHSLMPETDLSPVTASHKNGFIKETKLSPLPVSDKDNLMQETDLSQTMSSHENDLKLQFNKGAQVCDFDTMQQDVDLIELSDKRETVSGDLCPNVGAESAIKTEEGRLDQSDSLKVSDLDLVGDKEDAALHDNTTLAQSTAAGSSTEPPEKQLEELGATAGANASATDDLCQLPLENKDVQLNNIECNVSIEVGAFGSPKSKNDMICSSMDNIMHPGLHTDVLPGIPDSYGLAFSDFLGADIPCYPPIQSDLHSGIGASDSEGIAIMDDPIYGSLTDIGFMDVWGQPTQDYDKFF
ncbi:hypothetical protein QOZ80_2AG0133470 [Eleusine coracana subsp. coracana]|nr:hypothetical protein QOZ80_2AG0133470 [Eleusine coracana subsp. coracana]